MTPDRSEAERMNLPEPSPGTPRTHEENIRIAVRLREFSDLLEQQGEDGFRVRAYRNAASALEALPEPVGDLYRSGGLDALVGLKSVGRGIAGAIIEMLETGQWRQLGRLKGEVTPEKLFATIPGIGPALAHRLADELDVETLEELETALLLGKQQVPGIGTRRRQAILAALAARLSRMPRNAPPARTRVLPPVSLILDADALYRTRAAAGDLPRIAPKRFNPTGEAWLPIMHARRGDWHLTVLFSNTALAHTLDRTHDWVVIFFHRDDEPEDRCTVVTERQGPLSGKRVIRGRETECADHYDKSPALIEPVDDASA